MSWYNRRSRLNAAITAWRQKIRDEREAAELKAEQELQAAEDARDLVEKNKAVASALSYATIVSTLKGEIDLLVANINTELTNITNLTNAQSTITTSSAAETNLTSITTADGNIIKDFDTLVNRMSLIEANEESADDTAEDYAEARVHSTAAKADYDAAEVAYNSIITAKVTSSSAVVSTTKFYNNMVAAEERAAAEAEALRLANLAQAAAEAEAQLAADVATSADTKAQQALDAINNFESLPTSDANTRGTMLMSDGEGGAFWAYMGSTNTHTQVDNAQWLYRSIYTHGFLAAGYKGSNPWRSVNKTWHATEITMYCGEQIAYTQGYTNGVWSDYHSYVVAGAGFNAATAIICSHNLMNGSIRTFTADGFSSEGVSYNYVGNDPKNEGLSYGAPGYGNNVGGMKMSEAKLDPPATQAIKTQAGYIAGGETATNQKLNFSTEIMYTTTTNSNTGRGDASYGPDYGWFRFAGTTYARMAFSNDSWIAGGWSCSSGDYHSKMMGTKHGHFYADDGTNNTLPKRKLNQSTGASISTFNKVRSYGEANNEDGQDKGFVMGHYDGQQNNHTIRCPYTTDTEVTLGAVSMPKGHYGQSSGACSTAAATIASMSGVN